MSLVTGRHWTWGHLTWTLWMVRHAPHVIMSPPAWGMVTCQWPIRGLVWPIRGQWLEECQACIPNIISVPAIRDKTYFNKYPNLVNGDKKGFLKREDGFGKYEKYRIAMYVITDLFCCHLFLWKVFPFPQFFMRNNQWSQQTTHQVSDTKTDPPPPWPWWHQAQCEQQPITVQYSL